MMGTVAVWPTELKVAERGRLLKVAFDNGEAFALPAEYLRVMSPSAEVRGHNRKERKTVGGKKDVAIIGADPVGTYAVRISFDDMHSSGIYTWAYLQELGASQHEKWAHYLTSLEEQGLSRERPGEAYAENL